MKDELVCKFENVMLVDDNLIDLYIASRMITKNNFGKNVLQFSSGTEALKYLLENQENIHLLPNVIFLDIYMPGMTGFGFMAEYENLPVAIKIHCRVFFISSSTDTQDLNYANNDKNIVAMLEKPITKEFLLRYNR